MRQLSYSEYMRLDLKDYVAAGPYCFGQIVDDGWFIVTKKQGTIRVFQMDTPEEMHQEFDRLGKEMDRLIAMKNAIRERRACSG